MIWGLVATFGLTLACVVAVSGIRNDKWIGGAVVAGILGSLALYAAAYARGAARAAFMAASHEVIIRNPLRTMTIPTAEVSRFSAGKQRTGIGNPTPGILVERRDGRCYPIWTLAREGYVWNSQKNTEAWSGVAEDLNRLLHD